MTTVSTGPERDERLHELRKAARRAHYAAEALEPVSGAAASLVSPRRPASCS